MQYILSLLFAALLVIAQTSWKLAVGTSHNPYQTGLSILGIVRFMLSPLVVLGIVIYFLAVLLYMFLLSKYQFSLVQSLSIPLSLIFSILVAVGFFRESLSYTNYFGLLFIVCGIVLVALR